MSHVVLKEFHLQRQAAYFTDYCRRLTDMPMLVMLEPRDGRFVPGRFLRASDLDSALEQAHQAEWKTLGFDAADRSVVVPNGAIGFRWGDAGKWNLEARDARAGAEASLALTLADRGDDVVPVAFPYFGGKAPAAFRPTAHDEVLVRNVPVRRVQTVAGEVAVATVFDLLAANHGIDRGFGGDNVASSYDDDVPYTPAWAEYITGVPRAQIIAVARQFAENAEKTHGKSMVILGAGLNHWYHMDMIYRGIINLLMMCGCIGQSGGGWSHYVGQEKLRPQTGWTRARLCAGLAPPAAADEFHQLLLQSYRRSGATKSWRSARSPRRLTDTAATAAHADRLQREGRADGLAALGAATWRPIRLGSRRRRKPRPRRCRTMSRARCDPGALHFASRGPRRAGEFPAQHVRLAVQSARRLGQGSRVFPEIPAGHRPRRAGQGPWRRRCRETRGSALARRGDEENSTCW